MMKKYSRHYRRKVNYRNLLVVGLAGICAIAVLAGAGWFIYRTMFYDPFPQDESLTKSAGNVQQEIDEENGWMARYPDFEDEALDAAIEQVVDECRKGSGPDAKVMLDYRSKTVFDHYTSVLFKETRQGEKGETIRYHSVNYDEKTKQLMDVEDILRNQYRRDLLKGAEADAIQAIEINEKDTVVYLTDGSNTTIRYDEHKAYIALTDPGIPSLYQKEPLTIAEPQQIDPDKPMIALTFDDGPNPNTTPELLDLLKQYDARATFFMVGTNATNYPQVVERICKEGHELGNHSWSHEDLGAMDSADEILESYQKADDAIFEACGHDAGVVRPPYGSMSKLYDATVERESILWSIDTRDWESHDPKAIESIIDTYVCDGAVILLHDIHPESVAAMKRVLPKLKEKGYQFVTINDLIRYGKI